MFDHMLKQMRQLERGIEIPISLELDVDGYLDRQCPADECQSQFKIMCDDWKGIVRDEEVFCPLCRHDAPSDDWNTQAQSLFIERSAERYLKQQLGQAIRRDTQRFNRSQPRNSLINLSMSCKVPHAPIPVTPLASELMTQQVKCEVCACRYSSVGAAFFCPACGHNAVLRTFDNALQTVLRTTAQIDEIRQTLTEATDKDTAADAVRQICENGLVKTVSSFQRFAEASFHQLPSAGDHRVRFNLFQNLVESDELWRQATGEGYRDRLGEHRYEKLVVMFQQRHLFVHAEGIVDQAYIERSSDHRYRIGQRLRASPDAVTEFAHIVIALAGSLQKTIAEASS